MYKLTLRGNTRYAEFDLDPKSEACEMTLLDVLDERDKNDCLSVVIRNPENRSNLEENWMVLCGKPWQITWTMDHQYQIAKLESNRIFDCLDTIGKDEVVAITYPTEEPSFIIRKSAIHRRMRSSAAKVISKMFSVDPDSVYVLPEREL